MIDSEKCEKSRILKVFLLKAALNGWNEKSLDQAISDLRLDEMDKLREFPGGISDIVDYFGVWSDQRMISTLNQMTLSDMRVKDRIHSCVKLRLQINKNYRESIRRLLPYLSLPMNSMLGFRLCWRTSSEIWYASGDRSTDWNYYSKRALLASVYSATIMFWLSDEPDDTGDYPETWMFLERRIQNILDSFRLPQYFKNFLNCNSQKTG